MKRSDQAVNKPNIKRSLEVINGDNISSNAGIGPEGLSVPIFGTAQEPGGLAHFQNRPSVDAPNHKK